MIHTLKLREDYVQPVLLGEKTFEVRENDRGYQKGDYVYFKAISRRGVPLTDTILEQRTYQITYVHSGLGLKENYVVFGIKEVGKRAWEVKNYIAEEVKEPKEEETNHAK